MTPDADPRPDAGPDPRPDAGPDRRPDPGAAGTLRGVLVILAAGLALGVLNNAIARASRPPRGLTWLKASEAPVRLDTLLPDAGASIDSSDAASPDLAPAPSPAPARATRDSVPTPGAIGPPVRAGARPPAAASAPPAASSSPAISSPSPSSTSSPAPSPSPAAATVPGSNLPAIPELDRPIEIDLATLKRFHDAGAVLVVDAREAAEYEDGHIAGAVSLPYTDALRDPERIARLGEAGRPIVVYCSGGGCELSMDLAKLLLERGRRRVLVYEGGWPEWASMEYPSARGPQPGGR